MNPPNISLDSDLVEKVSLGSAQGTLMAGKMAVKTTCLNLLLLRLFEIQQCQLLGYFCGLESRSQSFLSFTFASCWVLIILSLKIWSIF